MLCARFLALWKTCTYHLFNTQNRVLYIFFENVFLNAILRVGKRVLYTFSWLITDVFYSQSPSGVIFIDFSTICTLRSEHVFRSENVYCTRSQVGKRVLYTFSGVLENVYSTRFSA